jgi:hypothetical protein
MAPAGLDFGDRSCYAAGTSSLGVARDGVTDLGLDTTANVLSQLQDGPDPTQPSQTLQGG